MLTPQQRAFLELLGIDVPDPPGAGRPATDASAVLQALAGVSLPPGASADDKKELASRSGAIRQLLDDNATGATIGAAASLLDELNGWRDEVAVRIQTTRDARRKALIGGLDRIIFSALMHTDARRGFSARKKALADDIGSAPDDTALDTAEAAIAALAKDVADRDKLIGARADARACLTTARETFAGARPQLDQGGFTLLEARLAASVRAFDDAASLSDYAAAKKLAQDFVPLSKDAIAHGAAFDAWNAKTTTYIANDIANDTDRKTLRALRRTLMADAAKLAGQAKFAAAMAKLDEFANDPLVVSATLNDAGAFSARLLDFQTNHMKDFDFVIAAGLPDSNAHKNDFRDAANEGLVNKNYPNAIVLIQAVIAWYTPRLEVARKVAGLDNRLRKHPGFRTALTDMKNNYDKGDFVGAAKAFDALGPDIMLEGKVHARLKRLEPEYNALFAILKNSEKAALKTEWDAANQKASDGHRKPANDGSRAGLFQAASNHLDKVEAMLPLAELDEIHAGVKPVLAAYASADGYGYLDGYRSDRSAGNLGSARTKLIAAKALLSDLVTYLDLKKRAEDVRSALPASAADLIARLETGLTDAEELARDKSDPAGAAGVLTALLNQTDFEALASDIRDYQALLALTRKRQARVLKLLELPKPTMAVTDSLAGAIAKADPGGDFRAAYQALVAHDELLTRARTYGAIRRQAHGVFNALERAIKSDPAREAAIFKFPPPSRAGLKVAFDRAEADAAKGNFDAALKEFRKLMADCKTATAECARIYETADGVNSNAGHSLGRHGPGISKELLVRRLKTGIAPDGLKSPTGSSSKFKSMEDWIAGREIGAQRALDEKGVDVDQTEILPPFDLSKEPLPAKLIIDHGKPIDEAYIGIKKTEYLDVNKGEIVQGKHYESFEEMSDLTRSLVNFTWEYDLIDSQPWPQDGDGNDIKPQNNAQYVAAYNAHFGHDPARITGRYVMMQQYPVAEDWDDELKQYTS